jgi:hypothetical protein
MGMLDKPVEALLNKLLDPKRAVEKAEESVKEKIVFLHESILHCHNAYLRHKSDQTEENLIAWRWSLGILIRVLKEVRLTLATFAPEAYESAKMYLEDEGEFINPFTGAPNEEVAEDEAAFKVIVHPDSLNYVRPDEEVEYEAASELTMLLDSLNYVKTRRPDVPVDILNVFEDATTKLREFIKSKLTMGEVHKAQQAFEEYIRP